MWTSHQIMSSELSQCNILTIYHEARERRVFPACLCLECDRHVMCVACYLRNLSCKDVKKLKSNTVDNKAQSDSSLGRQWRLVGARRTNRVGKSAWRKFVSFDYGDFVARFIFVPCLAQGVALRFPRMTRVSRFRLTLVLWAWRPCDNITFDSSLLRLFYSSFHV